MSDIPDNSYMDEVNHPEDGSLSDDVQSEDIFLSPGEDMQLPENHDANFDSADVDAEECIESIRETVIQLQAIAVQLACQEIALAEESLKKYRKFVEIQNIRATFREISRGLQTSLSDLDTYIMKKLEILRMNAADRIAVRPLFERAGYEIVSKDPLFTRTGLPKAISMPDNLTALLDISSVSSLCQEYPEMTINILG